MDGHNAEAVRFLLRWLQRNIVFAKNKIEYIQTVVSCGENKIAMCRIIDLLWHTSLAP